MGAIQNSALGVVGTASAALIAASNAQDEKAKKEEQGLLAKEQYHESKAELSKLESESKEAEKALEKASQAVTKSEDWKASDKNAKMLEGKKAKLLSQKEAAQRAFDQLKDEMEAKRAMMLRAASVMNRTGVGGKK